MTIDEFKRHLEASVRVIVTDAAKKAATYLRDTTPGQRTRTRGAVQATARGQRASVGLRFRTKYLTRNTRTLALFRRQWKALRPKLRARIIHKLNSALRGN